MGLIFDTSKIEDSFYGYYIFEKIIPLFNKNSSHSVLCGDYIGENYIQTELISNFIREINLQKKFKYIHSSQFFIVYINNLSSQMFKHFILKLKEFDSYIGHFDLTNQSVIKSYLSNILINSFIKYKETIVMAHEADRENSENINITGFPFEENNYQVKSIQDLYFDLFLSYKIEREVYIGFETDLDFSLNSISPIISNFEEIEIADEKIQYLKRIKTGKMKKINLINSSKEELIEIIKSKIKSNYIYNMTELKLHDVLKFDIIVELKNSFKEIVKVTIGFEYLPKHSKLRLITLY